MSDYTIPRPLFCNHDTALNWVNRRLRKYAEIRAVALILKAYPPKNPTEPNNDMTWSVNLKGGDIQPDAGNISEFQRRVITLLQEDAILNKTEPMIIWLPNAVKYIWSIQLTQPNKNSTKI